MREGNFYLRLQRQTIKQPNFSASFTYGIHVLNREGKTAHISKSKHIICMEVEVSLNSILCGLCKVRIRRGVNAA